MEVLEMFLKDMGIDVEITEEEGVATALSSEVDYNDVVEKISHNAYYFNKTEFLDNRLSMRLRGFTLGMWTQYRLEVSVSSKGTQYRCWVVGYETIMDSGVVAITDSVTSKNRFEV